MLTPETIKIGVVATLLGPYAAMGEDGIRGAELAVIEANRKIAGKRILLYQEGSNAIPDNAVAAVRKLLDEDGVDFVVGPLSGNEGIAVRDYAKTRPDKAFINGLAGAQEMTLYDPAPNFFSFTMNGVQWMAGLGKYVYEKYGYRRVVTLAEDYSYPYSQIAAFTLEFCRAGGKIVERYWTPLGKSDYRSIIESMPRDGLDAILVALGGSDALNFLKQYMEYDLKLPLIGGTLTVDNTILAATGDLSDRLIGMPSASVIADDNPYVAWEPFIQSYRQAFPKGLGSPSLFSHGYYVNMTAALTALGQIDADLSNGQERFKQALANLEFASPTGKVKLDHNRQAIADNFISVLDRRPDGSLYRKWVSTIPAVNQTLGIPEAEYLKIGHLTRDNPPACTEQTGLNTQADKETPHKF
ncbi:MAG TPA: ABC transporter substrate-binding protein [Phototrophicaceae bacterium]|jgi:branched-chain amino acid transport system substrate-binding protein|nr:ABC transporter substrate-binding protein [Phototrophicaceae bacterium]